MQDSAQSHSRTRSAFAHATATTMLHIVATLLGHAADSPTLSHFPPSSGPDQKEPVLTLSFYVVFMVHHIQPCSIDNYLSGIVSQLEPHFPSVCAARNSDLVHRTMGAPCNTSLSLSALVSPFPGWILIMPFRSLPACWWHDIAGCCWCLARSDPGHWSLVLFCLAALH